MTLRKEDDIVALRMGIDTLRLLNVHRSLSAAELARELQISRPATYRVLNTLQAAGYITREAKRGARYQPTAQVRSLSDGFHGDRRLLHVAQPLMRVVTEAHGWPLALCTPAGDYLHVRYTTDSFTTRVLTRYRGGFKSSLLTSASGLVCLAHQSAPRRSAVLRMLQKAPHQPTPFLQDPARLERDLDLARRRGWVDTGSDDARRDRDWVDSSVSEARERNLAVPILHHGVLSAALVLRYMRVASGGTKGFAERLAKLRELRTAIERRLAEIEGNQRDLPVLPTTRAAL